MKNILVFNNATNQRTTIEFEGETWGELKVLIEEEGISLENVNFTFKDEEGSKTRLAYDSTKIESSGTLFMLPAKQKAGVGYSKQELEDLSVIELRDLASGKVSTRGRKEDLVERLYIYFQGFSAGHSGEITSPEDASKDLKEYIAGRLRDLASEISEEEDKEELEDRGETLEEKLRREAQELLEEED